MVDQVLEHQRRLGGEDVRRIGSGQFGIQDRSDLLLHGGAVDTRHTTMVLPWNPRPRKCCTRSAAMVVSRLWRVSTS